MCQIIFYIFAMFVHNQRWMLKNGTQLRVREIQKTYKCIYLTESVCMHVCYSYFPVYLELIEWVGFSVIWDCYVEFNECGF